MRALIADDDPVCCELLEGLTTSWGFEVVIAHDGVEAMEILRQSGAPRLIILDWNMPRMDGCQVCHELRREPNGDLPYILLVTSSRNREDLMKVVVAGADDYLTKPFSMPELLARIRAGIRRAHAVPHTEPAFRTGDLCIDMARHLVAMAGREVKLARMEYEVLRYLALNADRVITHRVLLREVWGPQYEGDVEYLRVHINRLRRKIEPEPARPRYLITEPGVGYRLRLQEQA